MGSYFGPQSFTASLDSTIAINQFKPFDWKHFNNHWIIETVPVRIYEFCPSLSRCGQTRPSHLSAISVGVAVEATDRLDSHSGKVSGDGVNGLACYWRAYGEHVWMSRRFPASSTVSAHCSALPARSFTSFWCPLSSSVKETGTPGDTNREREWADGGEETEAQSQF